jgi:parvulin-like peptidyl-prolyl isomerase
VRLAKARNPARWVVGLALVAGLASACSGSDDSSDADAFEFTGSAASVEGREIPAQEIADQLEVFKAVPEAASIALEVDAVMEEGSDQPTPAAVADILGTEVAVTAIQNELAKRNLPLTPSSLEVADTTVRGRFGSLADQLPPDFLQRTIDRYAAFVTLDQELAPKYSDEELRTEYARTPADYERACVRHILLERPDEADAVVAELRAGADFAELARTRSKDPLSAVEGGDLGCVPRGSFTEAFEKAVWEGPLNEVQAPVRSEFGAHVIQVTRRGLFPFEEVKEDVIVALSAPSFTSLGIWLRLNLPKAAISVDPRFGVWDAKSATVLPRGTTTEGLTLTPGQDDPASPSPTSTPAAPSTTGTPSTTAGR